MTTRDIVIEIIGGIAFILVLTSVHFMMPYQPGMHSEAAYRETMK